MTDPYWDRFDREVLDEAHLTFCVGCTRCNRLEDDWGVRGTCCGAVVQCSDCCEGKRSMVFRDGHNAGTVESDPWSGRVVLEWADDGVVQTRVSFSADGAEAYANAILAAAEAVQG